MSIKKFSVMMLSALSLAALLNGCGSSSKESAISAGDVVARVGDGICVQCHSAVTDKLTGESIVAQYQKSAHYLGGQGCESCHGGGAQHNGVGPIPFATPDAARCATCHTETTSTVLALGMTQASSETNPSNPSNHANGGYEGVATGEPCYRCHTGEGAVLSNVAGYTGSYGLSGAAVGSTGSISTPASVLGNNAYKLIQDRDFSKFKGIQCSTCHEHGGVLRPVKTRDTTNNAVVAWDPNKNRKVDQFDLCTSCHNYLENDGTTLIASGSAAAGTKPATNFFLHNTAWYRIIASTHWDNPATTGTGGVNTPIEGYVIRKTGANPCFDCHGHEAKTNTRPDANPARPATTYTDWANSAHAGKLLANKIAASKNVDGTFKARSQTTVDDVMNAFTDNTTGTWGSYDWDAGNRGQCQRCHTATGAENFMKNPPKFNADGTNDVANGYYVAQAYVASTSTDPLRTVKNSKLNSFTHLAGWSRSSTGTVTSSAQNELLNCWGCHSNAGKGTLHKPGPFSFWYGNDKTNANPNGVLVTFPDSGNSNVCMTCHSGRTEIAQIIKNDNRDGSNVSIMYPHYMPSSLIVFGNGGYEYSGRSYAAPSFFAHNKIGISADGTGTTSGPCAGCHMTSANKHKFTNVTKDNAGVITGITSTLCATCHKGSFELTAAKLEEEKEGYEAALKALAAAFVPKGIYYDASTNNYFFSDPTARATANRVTNWKAIADTYSPAIDWKNLMGAAYNLYTLGHDAGFAHNRFYSKRLIWDSIDTVSNGALDDDVVAAITAQETAGRITAAESAAAKAYLGTARP